SSLMSPPSSVPATPTSTARWVTESTSDNPQPCCNNFGARWVRSPGRLCYVRMDDGVGRISGSDNCTGSSK
ncbi:MAG: hypothetical protein IJA63_03830, partial [Akkermansia sp.]|nr:hypothetical protein [Akkermansia sp.]